MDWILASTKTALLPAVLLLLPACKSQKGSAALVKAGRAVGSTEQLCTSDSGPIAVSSDSIDGLAVSANFRTLRRACPAAKDTVLEGSEGSVSPGLSFPYLGLRVVAVQYRKALAEGQRPDAWILEGRNARLPNGLSLTARWSDLRRTYGPAIGDQEGAVNVVFCRMPKLVFMLKMVATAGGSVVDWSTIPDDTEVEQLRIYPVPPIDPSSC